MKKLSGFVQSKVWLLLLFACLLSFEGYTQLVANFNADTTTGCEPVVIKFNDLSTGNPTSWLWDLGNGITSTQKNPVTFYFDAGSYTISLRVVNGTDTQTIVREKYITVYGLPEINFALSDTVGCFPFTARFTDLTIPRSGEIKSLQWDFGDGTFSNESITNHTYNVEGDFSISLFVTNTFGCKSLLSKRNLVTVLSGVKAGFELANDTTCNAPANFKFINTSEGKDINIYKWDFGDGQTDTTTSPTHTFVNSGSYSVALTVANTDGCTDSIFKKDFVRIGFVKASFNSVDSVCERTSVVFSNTSQPVPTSVLWRFGDGSTSTSLNPTKSYASAGTYTVSLTSFFGGCSDVVTKTINVMALPAATFTTVGPLSTCKDPLTVEFNSTNPALKAYAWSFGDGGTSTLSNPTYTYNTPGLYNVTLQVTGTNGCINRLTRNNLVYYGPPSVLGITGFPHYGCAPFATQLFAPINSPEPVVSYLWNFGDSATSTEKNPIHEWPNEGSYDISVSIETVSGCTTTFKLTNALVINKKPVIAFSATPQNACAFQQISFFDSTAGNVTKLKWLFGDGGTSDEKNPVYNYIDTGKFQVILIATNQGCTDSLRVPDFININPPIARFQILPNCATPSSRQFKDSSIGATNWSWNFGDGGTSTEKSPQHTYLQSGVYTVQLEVSNGACTHRIVQTVSIVDEKPVLSVNNGGNCKSSVNRFVVENISANLYTQFLWDFGDGTTSNTQSGLTTFTYSIPGLFKPSVTLVDVNGCRKKIEGGTSLNVLGPVANFSIQPQACVQSVVEIVNKSTATAGFPIATYIWNYGDGTIDTLTGGPVQHIYKTGGSFTVQLKVIDAIGCTDNFTKNAAIQINNPKALFKLSDSIKCRLSDVNFTSTSTGMFIKHLWDLGNGTTSTNRQFVYKYPVENTYKISLIVTDTFGCRDTLVKPNAIKIADVKAKLQTNDTVSSCPPFIVTLNNQSTNYASFSWDFDDGSFSNLDTPSHYYNIPRKYFLKLVANGYGSCTDTARTTVTLFGPSGSFKYSPFNICSPGVATFIASTLNMASYVWDFGDGTIERTNDSITLHEYVNPGQYKPKLLLLDVAGCQVPIIGNDTIVIVKARSGIKIDNSLFCDSASIQFFDSSKVDFDRITNYSWNFGDGSKESISQNPIHKYQSPGIYPVSLTITTKSGCSNTSTMQTAVKVVKSPSIKIISNTSVCQDSTVIFKGEELVKDTSLLRWKWDFGNGQTASVQNPAVQVYKNAGTYIINATATNSSGCAVVSRQNFTVHPTPNVQAGNDTVLCVGNTLILQPAGANTYRWTSQPTLSCTNCSNPIAAPVLPTTYKVDGTSMFGCTNSDTIRLGVTYPFKATTSFNDTLCIGEKAQLFSSGSDLFTWSPATSLNNASAANPVASPTTTTNYRVVVADKYKCFTDTGYVNIAVYPIPVINIEQKEYTLSVGNSVTLKTTMSNDVSNIRWTPLVGLSCTNCPQPIASPRNTINYFVRATNDGGCRTEDRITVNVICSNANIYIPNTFSPNGDGMNDVFYVRGKGVAAVKAVTIFNRWGIVVYQKTNISINDPSIGWDGTYNSTMLSPDVYVYKVDVVCENNQLFSFKGDITLIR